MFSESQGLECGCWERYIILSQVLRCILRKQLGDVISAIPEISKMSPQTLSVYQRFALTVFFFFFYCLKKIFLLVFSFGIAVKEVFVLG